MKEPTPDWNLEGQGSDPFCGGQVVEIVVCQMGWKSVQCLHGRSVGPMDMGSEWVGLLLFSKCGGLLHG